MNRLLVTGMAMVLASASASAADMAAQAPITKAAAAVAYDWTGIYAGVNAGGAFSSGNTIRPIGDTASLAFAGAGVFPGALSNKRSGFTGGLQLGANYQIGQFVIGAETDWQALGFAKKSNFTLASGTVGSLKETNSWLGTTRIRLGFTPVDRLLVYGTGGVAYGNVGMSGGFVSPTQGNAMWLGQNSDTKFGWALGAGAEYAITNNLTAKLEYLYYDLGSSNLVMGAANAAAVAVASTPAFRAENRGNIIRAGLNYKF